MLLMIMCGVNDLKCFKYTAHWNIVMVTCNLQWQWLTSLWHFRSHLVVRCDPDNFLSICSNSSAWLNIEVILLKFIFWVSNDSHSSADLKGSCKKIVVSFFTENEATIRFDSQQSRWIKTVSSLKGGKMCQTLQYEFVIPPLQHNSRLCCLYVCSVFSSRQFSHTWLNAKLSICLYLGVNIEFRQSHHKADNFLRDTECFTTQFSAGDWTDFKGPQRSCVYCVSVCLW